MTLILEPYDDLPLFDLRVVVRGGSADDPRGREGLAHHAAELARRGSKTRARAAFDDAVDALGASLQIESGYDTITMTGHVLARHADALVELAAELLAAPAIEADEHAKLVRENLASLDAMRDDDEALAWRHFVRAALAGHPYGRTSLGTEASLNALTVADTRAWAERTFVRDGVLIGFAGAFTPAEAEGRAARLVGALPDRPAAPRPAAPAAELPPAPRIILVDKPERTQSQIVIGHRGPPAAHEDWLPIHVVCAIFGGGFTSRLMSEVRVKRGWSYGASARVVRARETHAFNLRVAPSMEQTADTLALVFAMWRELADQGVTAAELEFIKGYLSGRWAFDIDTAPKRLDDKIEALGLGVADPSRLLARLQLLTLDEVNAALRRWLAPDRAITALTCTARELAPRLEALGLGTIEVAAYDAY